MPRFARWSSRDRFILLLYRHNLLQVNRYKSRSVGTVNITINGVNSPLQGANQPVSQAVPCCLPYYVPQCIPQQQPANLPAQDIKKMPLLKRKNKYLRLKKKINREQKPEAKTNKKPIIELTDAYIQQLEQRLKQQETS